MPLTFAHAGQPGVISRVTGRDHTRRFLAGLGLTPGETVTIVSEHGGDLILQVRETRVALSRAIASRILLA